MGLFSGVGFGFLVPVKRILNVSEYQDILDNFNFVGTVW